MYNIDSLKCPFTQDVIEYPVITPCGHTFEHSFLTDLMEYHPYCPIDGTPIEAEDLRLNHLHKTVTFKILLNAANQHNKPKTRRITLCFSPPVPRPSDELIDLNRFYEWTKKVGGYDSQYFISLLCPLSRQPIQEPVVGRCGHTFDFASILDDGAICPFDGIFSAPDKVYENLSMFLYIDHLIDEDPLVPTNIEGIILDLKTSTTMKQLGDIAKRLGSDYKIARIRISDGYFFLPEDATLGDFDLSTFFTNRVPGYDFSLLEQGY